MASVEPQAEKAHVVCVPFPAQGHINPMMNLAKLLHSRGFHVTFALTHYHHTRLLSSRGPHALDGLPSFRFVSFPNGLLPLAAAAEANQDVIALIDSLDRNCAGPLTDLLRGLNNVGPRVTCIVGDVGMAFTLEVAEALGIKEVMLWPISACGLLGYDLYPRLIREGYTPLKDSSYLTNGYLDTPLDWIPSMKGIHLKDLPTFIRTTNPDDIMLRFMKSMVERSRKASAIIINTYNDLEDEFIASLAPDFPPFYPVGPLHLLADHYHDQETMSIGSNLWKPDPRCIQWLDSKDDGSVVYVNFGSLVVLTHVQLVEFAFGLANSEEHFLWVIRPDLVVGESAVLPPEFLEETKNRRLLVDWCDQERVLSHAAVGGFLTHSGWNSTIESIGNGVPMISWPFFSDQQTNCWACCNKWGIGMEVDNDVKRENVERQVRMLMDGEKGNEMRRRVMEWKLMAEKAVAKGSGQSWKNLDKLVTKILVSPY